MADIDLGQLKDRDILIMVATEMRTVLRTVEDHEKRLKAIESHLDRQAGIWAGGKALWAVIGAGPAAIISWFLSH